MKRKVLSVREKQLAALKRVLNAPELPDKVLLVDSYGHDLTSALLSKDDLLQLGVKVRAHLKSRRDFRRQSAAIYLCALTEQNMIHIRTDVADGRYARYYINWMSALSIPRFQLNLNDQLVTLINERIDFVLIEDDLFVSRYANERPGDVSYGALMGPRPSQALLDGLLDGMADGLLSLFTVLGCVPVIQCSRDGLADSLAARLDVRLKKHMLAILGVEHRTFERPLLVIVERDFDLTAPLLHPTTYQGLLQDLDHCLWNNVVDTRLVGHDVVSNAFWKENRGQSLTSITDQLKLDLGLNYERMEHFRKLDTTDSRQRIETTKQILKDRNLMLLRADNVSRLITKEHEAKLKVFAHHELNLIRRQEDPFESFHRGVLHAIRDRHFGTPHDKLRLFLIYYILTNVSEEHLRQCVGALAECGCSADSVHYIDEWKMLRKPALLDKAKEWLGLADRSPLELLVGFQKLPYGTAVTEAVHQLSNLETRTDFRYLNPKLGTQHDCGPKQDRSTRFQDVIVFVVGGGNYAEYHDLIEYAKLENKNVLYGCTTICQGGQFVDQLTALGRLYKGRPGS